jgi:CDP-diglyceride synthetase
MKTEARKSFLTTIPSAVLAIITLFLATIVLFGVGEGLGSALGSNESAGEAIGYLLYDVVIVFCCYLIVKANPASVWYVPLICNLLGIISALIEPNFWITPLWILICAGWVLSVAASFFGVRKGKKRNN